MVILAVGIEPRDDAGELEKILGITRSDDGCLWRQIVKVILMNHFQVG